ncbi:MAG: phosphatidylglycerophosphatase A [Betaproteobacteria bacterium]|nr:phosphatidylglycerophosphatase A [Betaproteobacteria bacterium]
MESVRPSWRFVLGHPAHLIAFGGGVGLMPVAPGTFGTLLALALFWLLAPWLDALHWLLLVAAMFVIGVWACDRTGRALGAADHGGMVWDEIVAFLLVLVFLPDALHWQATGFLLFRLFDILKPPPIRYCERALKGGLGVMADDIIAAFYALLLLAAFKAIFG